MNTKLGALSSPRIDILYEDGDLVVLNKPAGLVVNRAITVKAPTVQDWVGKNLKIAGRGQAGDRERDFFRRAGLVHRLDKETSGCLLVAKNPASFANLSGQFARREVGKVYWALVHGEVKPAEGRIEAPVQRNPFNRQRFGVFPGGREARTSYRLLKLFVSAAGQKYSLLEVYPRTGRTHQIRVHLKYAGWPLVADSFYAGRKISRQDRKWCPRLFLHARRITFSQPVSGERISVEAPLPVDLKAALASLAEIGY
jgi:23S rRNA pseudouridine1911/1915/1917 synthase